MFRNGQILLVNGKKLKVEMVHASGRHTQFHMEDGSILTDAHLDPNIKLAEVPDKLHRTEDWLPKVTEDHEE